MQDLERMVSDALKFIKIAQEETEEWIKEQALEKAYVRLNAARNTLAYHLKGENK